MDQRTIDILQQEWIVRAANEARAPVLQIGCGMKPIAGAVNMDPNPERWAWADLAGDAHRLPFADGVFGAVVSSHVIPHLADPVAALREMGRVLRIGGVMAHVVPDLRYAPHRHEPGRPFAHQPHGWYGPDDFLAVADRVRDLFVIVMEEFREFNWSFKVEAMRL